MTVSDRERLRLEKLEAAKRECHITAEDARREEGAGPEAAYREELARKPKLEYRPKFVVKRP